MLIQNIIIYRVAIIIDVVIVDPIWAGCWMFIIRYIEPVILFKKYMISSIPKNTNIKLKKATRTFFIITIVVINLKAVEILY